MANTFLKSTDYDNWIGETLMRQIIGTDFSLLNSPENMAQAMVTDACGNKYDLPAEFAKTGDDRNHTLRRWMLSIAAYFIYHDIADVDIPERIIKDYDDVRSELAQIASGKRDVDFTRLEDEDGYDQTNFMYGSDSVRTHDIY
jgi:hypothetical protein